ncbi:hypothetical protein VPH35_077723 [Triticum aestivum]|uniref:uncharacterized protein isoform X1 n=1 Tax=Triticum aestivum TaxID=4565 RepID=UPI00098B165C|nr:uncharacterized protein LOC109765753 [Aegilops tauschii subsp. strangulata]XP_044374660.1 uncharacterized protein LOC123096932 isoform X1 [Triticum aestivum]XP_044374661.1 uncharacterized protein LOC123096932 isoform X1 [Triticum aestivum]XP_044374662.1 uncharacterized protein LOC123096932 isoform X1 [Triticum aestivum]XP_044374663.1 uncharacterized protein LOC123096932 isoform X1 [Triticum aestivum]XP_044374664.1 uncharacterized protein LOC123096932 isoform X1 [Triticum aestivum]XP_045083
MQLLPAAAVCTMSEEDPSVDRTLWSTPGSSGQGGAQRVAAWALTRRRWGLGEPGRRRWGLGEEALGAASLGEEPMGVASWRRWVEELLVLGDGDVQELLVLGDGDVQELLGDAPGARGRWALGAARRQALRVGKNRGHGAMVSWVPSAMDAWVILNLNF